MIAFAALFVWSNVASAQPAQPPPPVSERPAAQAEYDKAFSALVDGDYDAAIAGMARASQLATLATTRAAANEMRRLAVQLKQRAASGGPATRSPLITARDREADRTAGRTTFITTTTIASMYAGIVLIDLLNQGDDFRASIGVVTAATALGFLGSFYGSRGHTITEGAADTYSLGLGLGLGNALLLALPLDLDTSEQFQSFVLAGSVAGGVAGMYLGDRLRPTRAQAHFVGTTSTLGIASVGLGLGILQPSGIDADTVLLLLAGGLDVGAGAGLYMSQDLDWSLSRARLVGLGTFLGAFAGWATGALLTGAEFDGNGDADARTWASTTLAGMWGGFALTWHLTRDMVPGKRHQIANAQQQFVLPTMVAGTAPGLAIAGSF